jgi:hypothetical protein
MHTQISPTKAIYGGLIVALIAAVPLKADDPIVFGGMLSYTSPSGDFSKISKSGFGATVFAEKIQDKNTAWRLRLEYVTFGEKENMLETRNTYKEGEKANSKAIALMADWVYRRDTHANITC